MKPRPRHSLSRACLPLWLWLALLLPPTATADELPYPAFTALYRLYVNGIAIGHQEITLVADPDSGYRYSAKTDSIGIAAFLRDDSLRELSRFSYDRGGIRPREYEYHHHRRDHERHVRISFDWEANQVVNEVQGEGWRMEVPDGALDKLVVQLALLLDLQRGKRELEYAIADGGHLKTFRYQLRRQEGLHTPAGRFHTLKLERLRADQDRTTYLWVAPELNYLPVQIKQIDQEDGTEYLSRLLTRDLLPDEQESGVRGQDKAKEP
ncbi:hypothetical protein TspCOW1_16200 [Thiohalobacter sp. COW1]|uniref:DUF3108 domain-containing protein n=1 Tax=Thiohalobacter sp. COW1 TaxID=2795687 RepID=UPI001915B87C|nr:DUF3108 domain-containing protein [Thiohalobacter sp. COW1]BCO31517.1 hypothetical protein TspCOW1_16200 [Thiohalobacter sp. COW1]